MKLDTITDVKEYLIAEGLVEALREPFVENLSGGVSSSVWKIVWNNNRWVMKQALEKLNVKEDWYSDVERIHREHEVMVALADLVPNAIPKVVHVDYKNHIYIMLCAEEGAQTWKDILMNGIFSVSLAENAGHLLRDVHQQSHRMTAADKERFQDQKYFVQLRVDPFHRHLIQKYPDLTTEIQKLVDEVTREKTCLVHGDFSPKNMLVEHGEHIVLIDFEVAHWGNPVFDVAYCVGHLMLKGWYLHKHSEMLTLAAAFLSGYGGAANNLMPHLGLMLLARMDGKSTVNYITGEKMKNDIRKVAINWIRGKAEDANTLYNIEKAFEMN